MIEIARMPTLRPIVLVLLSALLLCACAESNEIPQALPYGRVEVLGRQGAVVRPGRFRRRGESAHWRLMRPDLEGFEAGLEAYVRSLPVDERRAMRFDDALATRLHDYRRQYLGVVVGGRRLLRVSLVCERMAVGEEHIDVWLERFDGGECNCEALYDPELDEHRDFRTGGDA